ncbi:hypothetical protein [Candidatus Pelagibacter bacterium nBUS_32]|uniref:hypothetical protein n=1 Tax=Candidatus Pelagibacter bacterium nBUS_32 TaxID=3374192 RepID=UPI003EBA694F
MKILRLLNKKYLSVIIIYLLSSLSLIAEDKPIDIWNIDKKETEDVIESESSTEKLEVISENSVYDMQTDKKKIR